MTCWELAALLEDFILPLVERNEFFRAFPRSRAGHEARCSLLFRRSEWLMTLHANLSGFGVCMSQEALLTVVPGAIVVPEWRTHPGG
jgi:hypothetical protein